MHWQSFLTYMQSARKIKKSAKCNKINTQSRIKYKESCLQNSPFGALTRHVCENIRTKKYLFSTLNYSHINSLQELYLQTCFLTIFNVT